jgi:SpoIID/LytB domain protein
MRRIATTAFAAAILAGVLASPAAGADRWSLRGAGWGHGIGMSQYGAYGFAKHGSDYRAILGHYYQGTAIGRRDGGTVRVLLEPNQKAIMFRSAGSADGRALDPNKLYKATRSGATVVLRKVGGGVVKRAVGMITVTGAPRVTLIGKADNGVLNGVYRGNIEIRTAVGPGINSINALDLESYVRGVVPNESPSGWPAAALEAQAVAARTYAITSNVGGRAFNQYADVRSQVYRGFLSETPSTGAAVTATRGEVVTYSGKAVTTFFFSTSGGFTENNENVFGGANPLPWLRGVEDPYDDASPYHRWGPFSFSNKGLGAKLGSWVRGRFRGLDVLQRGASPRVVRAEVRGSGGNTVVTGPQLRSRLGLRDSWFYLRRVSSTTDSGLRARTSSGTHAVAAIRGSVSSTRQRFVTLQRQVHGKWAKVVDVPLEHNRYAIHVAKAGSYRVLAGWAAGPTLRVAP